MADNIEDKVTLAELHSVGAASEALAGQGYLADRPLAMAVHLAVVLEQPQTLFLVQPDTLLRWHRELFRLYWKRMSKASSYKPKVAVETIELIREMATENRLWGAERIRGELLKLGVYVCKRTIQKYINRSNL